MRRPALLLLLALAAAAAPARAQDDAGLPCEGVLAAAERLPAVLGQVPKYGSTYVLVYPESLGAVGALDAPELEGKTIAVYEGSPAAAIAGRAGLAVEPRPAGEPGRIVEEVLAGEADAAVLWAPLAGLGALELDFNYELSFLTAGEPAPPPAAFQTVPGAAASAETADAACADAVRGLLEGYGVVPAEKLVPLDIRELLHLEAPPRDPAAAAEGAPLYAEHCAKCHGPQAVAATDALAPVDLLVSVRRFSYPGFLYIALNGRSQNGMPGFRGSLGRDEVRRIYQYVRERSHGAIGASGAE